MLPALAFTACTHAQELVAGAEEVEGLKRWLPKTLPPAAAEVTFGGPWLDMGCTSLTPLHVFPLFTDHVDLSHTQG